MSCGARYPEVTVISETVIEQYNTHEFQHC